MLLCCCAAVLLCCCAAVLLCCCAAVLLCCCAAGQDDWTPLYRAIVQGSHVRGISCVVKVLLQAGADPGARILGILAPQRRAFCMFTSLLVDHSFKPLVWLVLGILAMRGVPAPDTAMSGLLMEDDRIPSCYAGSTDELRWGQQRRARRWREAAAWQRRDVVFIFGSTGEDCGYAPDQPWTSDFERPAMAPHERRAAITESDDRKRGRSSTAALQHDSCILRLPNIQPRGPAGGGPFSW
jgi:hypothetical protein